MEKIEIIKVPDQTVVGFRKKGSEQEVTDTISEMFVCLTEQNDLDMCNAPIFVHHMDNEETELDLEVCFPIACNPVKQKINNKFRIYNLEGGKMAKITHKGPQEQCGLSYEKLFDWMEKNNYVPVGPPRNIQITPPTENPEDSVTEIHFPIAQVYMPVMDDESDE